MKYATCNRLPYDIICTNNAVSFFYEHHVAPGRHYYTDRGKIMSVPKVRRGKNETLYECENKTDSIVLNTEITLLQKNKNVFRYIKLTDQLWFKFRFA